jgi:hypothetical protein
MSSIATPTVIGRGAPGLSLSSIELREILAEAGRHRQGERVGLIPDKTRDDNTLLPAAFWSGRNRAVRRWLLKALIRQ